jgi:hypothetical protein
MFKPLTYHSLKKWTRKNLEQMVWKSGLQALFFMNAETTQPTFCILSNIGFSHCPGCGIGHAIHDVLHFQFWQSFQSHWMGLPAVVIIFFRMHQLIFFKNGGTINKTPLVDSK